MPRKKVAQPEKKPGTTSEKGGKQRKKKDVKKKVVAAEKKANLGDSGTIKRLLDDAAINVMLSEETGLGYDEDTALSNVKLLVGFSGVGASLLSHVYPATFPKNWWVLLFCCAFYFVSSGILQYILSFMEVESILLLRGKQDAQGKRGSALNLHSSFPRYQEIYTLSVTVLPRGSLSLALSPQFFTPDAGPHHKSWSVADFFDEEEVFHEEAFDKEVKAFLLAFEAEVTK